VKGPGVIVGLSDSAETEWLDKYSTNAPTTATEQKIECQ
jgi:hypothetical protein